VAKATGLLPTPSSLSPSLCFFATLALHPLPPLLDASRSTPPAARSSVRRRPTPVARLRLLRAAPSAAAVARRRSPDPACCVWLRPTPHAPHVSARSARLRPARSRPPLRHLTPVWPTAARRSLTRGRPSQSAPLPSDGMIPSPIFPLI